MATGKRRKKNVEYRRANMTGSITEIHRDDIRAKYSVRVTVGHKIDKNGKKVQDRRLVGYYETKEQAETALQNYLLDAQTNGELFDKNKANKIKIKDMWERFVEYKGKQNLSEKRMDAFGYDLIHIPEAVMELTFEQTNYQIWEKIFDDIKAKTSYSTLKRIRGDFSGMYNYAKRFEVTVPNYPEMYSLGKSLKKGKTLVFSKSEIETLWAKHYAMQGNTEARFAVNSVLILIYCGCRINELLDLKNEDVHMSEHYFEIINAKTPAGLRRIPIHKAVYHIWQEYFDPNNTYFLTMPHTGKKYTYANYRDSYWDRLVVELEWPEDMTPHNARKTFSSYMKYYNVNATCQKIILGHEGKMDLQESVYTAVPTSKIIEELGKIPTDYKKLVELVDEFNDVRTKKKLGTV